MPIAAVTHLFILKISCNKDVDVPMWLNFKQHHNYIQIWISRYSNLNIPKSRFIIKTLGFKFKYPGIQIWISQYIPFKYHDFQNNAITSNSILWTLSLSLSLFLSLSLSFYFSLYLSLYLSLSLCLSLYLSSPDDPRCCPPSDDVWNVDWNAEIVEIQMFYWQSA